MCVVFCVYRHQFYYNPARTPLYRQDIDRHSTLETGEGKKFHILVTGKARTGKSSLIQGLLGEGEVKEEKLKFTSNNFNVHGVKGVVEYWDCPGVYDGSLPKEKYVEMKEVMEEADLVLHTIKMDDTRLRPEDIKCVQQLTVAYGSNLWTKAIFVLTFANKVTYLNKHQQMTQSRIHIHKKRDEWKEHFHNVLREGGVSEEVLKGIPFFPAGHYSKMNLFEDDENWISGLHKHVAQRTRGWLAS